MTFSSSVPGDYTITVSISDAGTGTYNTNPATFTLHVLAPPNTAPTVPGTPTLKNGSVTPNQGLFSLTWTASTDAESNPITYALDHKDANDGAYSAVASSIATNEYAFNTEAEGTWTYRVKASDGSLESGYSGESSAIKVDKSNPNAPTLSAPAPNFAGNGGWYKDSVSITVTSNGDPALADGSAGSGVDPASFSSPIVKNMSGTHNVQQTVKDLVGNESTAGTISVNVDATKPLVQISGCPTAPVKLNSVASISWNASDAHSGLQTAANGTVSLVTSSIGTKTATAPTAKDNVGHDSDPATCPYSVVYDVKGFFQPVDNLPTLNTAKAGSAIPLKFSLGGNVGLSIFQSGYPASVAATCGVAAADAIEETVTAGGSTLSYDATTGQYIYVWKSEKSWSGTCRTLIVKFNDGSSQLIANFKFN